MDLIYIVVLFVVVLLQLATLKLGGWLIPFLFGAFGLAFAAAAVGQSANIPFFPYPVLLLGVTSAVTVFYSAFTLRGEN